MPLPMAFFADDRAVGKEVFTDGWSWPSVKVDLCRRRIPWPSAKSLAVGKVAVSGSDTFDIFINEKKQQRILPETMDKHSKKDRS
jgi:hypothetical protein